MQLAGDPLAVALGDDLKLESLLSLLKRELPSSGRVLLGATAGVRQAMQDSLAKDLVGEENTPVPQLCIESPRSFEDNGII